MTSTAGKIHALALVLLTLTTSAPARQHVAPADLSAAAKAVALAEEVGAPTYAPLELRYAGEQLEQARQLLENGDAAQARRLLEQSQVNSDLAVAKSRLGRTREAVQVQAAANAQLRADAAQPSAEQP